MIRIKSVLSYISIISIHSYIGIGLIFSFCIFHFQSIAQTTFQKTFGGVGIDVGYSVQQTTDGGYIMTGGGNMYLIKTDANGDMLWTKTYGGGGGQAVKQTTDGGYIVAGYTQSFGAGFSDVYLIKTDSIGDTLWTRTYGGADFDWGYAVQQTTDGGYIVAGYTKSFGAGSNDVYLIKTDSVGDTLWTKTYGGVNLDHGRGVQQTTDGGYIVAGWTRNFGAGVDDVYLIRTDSVGDTLWTKTYGGTFSDFGFAVQETDGGYIVIGQTGSYGATPGISYDVYLIKTDANGDTLWTKTYGGAFIDYGREVKETDGGYIVTGFTQSVAFGNFDVYLIKTDSIGDTLWTKAYGGGGNDYGSAVEQTNDGGYIVAGWTQSFGAGGSDVYLIKTDANGNSGCNQFNTNTIVSSGAVVGNPATIVGSGAIVNSTATVVTSPPTIDSTLCWAIDTTTITSDFTADDTIICEEDCINFFDLSIGFPTSWQWSFSGAIPSTSPAQNPTNICYNDTGTFNVQLIATNVNGSDTLSINSFIVVENCDTLNLLLDTILFIPNAFSPNGDGDNDILFVRAKGIKTINLKIYNRWGEKVFELSTVNYQLSTNKGWDGIYKGRRLNPGVFAWYAEVEFLDDSKIYRKGNVTLIR